MPTRNKKNTLNLMSPNSWSKTSKALMGPFSSEKVARYFASHVADLKGNHLHKNVLFVKGDSWFLDFR